jgi:hypothetical protein
LPAKAAATGENQKTSAFSLRDRQVIRSILLGQIRSRRIATMPALAELLAAEPRSYAPRIAELPTCPVCVDTMIAAEASVFYVGDQFISYLWACETCGYGFVTKHAISHGRCH